MYIDNAIQPGDYLTVVPIGIQVRLQYGSSGLLQSLIFKHIGSSYVSKFGNIVDLLKDNSICPESIHLSGGTTWVDGVLYVNKVLPKFSGSIDSEEFESGLLNLLIRSPQDFKFYAGNVESLATSFKGCAPIRNWLNMNGFNLLPGWVITNRLTKQALLNLLKGPTFNFMYPVVQSYMIFRKGDIKHVSTELKQLTVHSKQQTVDMYGYIHCTICDKDGTSVSVPYSNVLKFNLDVGTTIVLDKYQNIIYSDSNKVCTDKDIYCHTCGKLIHVRSNDVAVACNNPHCMSTKFADCCNLLKVLGLGTLSPVDYWNRVNAKSIISVPDVLDLVYYSRLDDAPLSVTLVDILSAIVPPSVTTDMSVFNRIANRCRNNLSTFECYIHNPDMLCDDIGSESPSFARFIKWLSDPYNQSNIDALLMQPRLNIVETNKLFQGPPVFLSKQIGITGTFLHGDHNQIKAILSSYGASVISSSDGLNASEYVSQLDYLIIGSQNEGTNGQVVREAKSKSVPVIQEIEFFNHYDIDSDIRQNL